MLHATWLRLLVFFAASAAVIVRAERYEDEETSVHSAVFNDYARTPSVLGGFQVETFAFANGGALLGHLRDRSVSDITFDQVVRLVSPALTRQNFVAASDPEDTDLLIYVTWGVSGGLAATRSALYNGTQDYLDTSPNGDWFGHSSQLELANRQRDGTNLVHAALLGYREALLSHRDLRAWGVNRSVYEELAADVEEPRYFVILTAFDFRTAWKSKRLIPLWSTRYNIPARGNRFDVALPSMTTFASRFFGRESGGLVRRLNPTGKVEMGDVQILGAVEDPAR